MVQAMSCARAALALALLAPFAGPPATSADEPAPGFTDVAARLGIVHPTFSGGPEKKHIREGLGQGVCWLDHDRDGDPDLLVLNGWRVLADPASAEPWHFYENRDGRFAEISVQAGLAGRAWALGCAVGDVDGDGFQDLFVTTAASPNLLFRNRGGGTFEDRTAASGLGHVDLSAGAAFGDLDGDGDLDLAVARHLDESQPPPPDNCRWKGAPVVCGPKGYPPLAPLVYLNRGDGSFEDTSERAGVADLPGFGLGVLMLDADGDGDADLYVANDSTPSRLLLNRGNATFEEWGLAAGVALSDDGRTQAGMGVDAGDLDGDGREDLVKTNFSDDVNNFYRNEGGAVFSEWSHRSGLAAASFSQLGWAVLLEDFDLDGDLDVFTVNGHVYPGVESFDPGTSYRQRLQLLFNDGRGRFREDPGRLGPAFAQPIAGRGAAAADFDGDGDLDIAVIRDGEPPLLLRNDLPAPGAHWLEVRLAGPRGNREGLGARIEIEAGGRRQVREVRRSRGYLSSSDAAVVFGLGTAPRVDRLTVHWPGGGVQSLEGLAADREWVIEHVPAAAD
ncbi:MAG TPA: CRTAC1 family protein [Thermoanaerobaculia bacterium]|nr:CRTAC1 family protein [Thermoanaerobaculia bacterium]